MTKRRPMSAETKAKISAAKRAHPYYHPPEVVAATNEKLRQKFRNGELIPPMHMPGVPEKVSKAQKDVPKTTQHKARISAGLKRAYREGRAVSGWKIAGNVSPGERQLWPGLRAFGFERGYVFPTNTRTRYIPDFVHPDKKLIVEIDGSSHTTFERALTDKRREDYIRQMGFEILHYPESVAREDPTYIIQEVFLVLNHR